MIVGFDDLAELRGNVTMVDGGFDPLHSGHVLYFRKAKKRGLPVLCNVASDEYVAAKHKVLLPHDVRCHIIDEFESIDYVHPSSRPLAEILEQARPAALVKGKDWKSTIPVDVAEICDRHRIEMVFLDSVIDSSSKRIKAFLRNPDLERQIAEYETFLHGQEAPSAKAFDEGYFHDNWRKGAGGNYTVADRRKLEGRHPGLIREVFDAKSVLDMGCGPGALIFLLDELGVRADGVDFAQASKQLAPPEVRERIRIGLVTDIDLPSASYELVICREVLEHMPVLQVQQAVQNMCRIASRYVYVTTRFHPQPQSLFDVTTEFDRDPTHITLMHVEMLRLMFVLQGLRRRRDLEERMDWLNKGRVLVYEKAG